MGWDQNLLFDCRGIAIVLLGSLVICPCALTVIFGICTRLPYVPATTPVLSIAIVPEVVIVPPLKPVPAVMLDTVPR